MRSLRGLKGCRQPGPADLATSAAALRPILRAAASAASIARDHAALVSRTATALKAAGEVVGRVTHRGNLAAFVLASADKAAIEGAEKAIDKWVAVLTAAIAVSLGGETLAQLTVASASAAAAQGALLAEMTVSKRASSASLGPPRLPRIHDRCTLFLRAPQTRGGCAWRNR